MIQTRIDPQIPSHPLNDHAPVQVAEQPSLNPFLSIHLLLLYKPHSHYPSEVFFRYSSMTFSPPAPGLSVPVLLSVIRFLDRLLIFSLLQPTLHQMVSSSSPW